MAARSILLILFFISGCALVPVKKVQDSSIIWTNSKYEVELDVSKFPQEDVQVNILGKKGIVVKANDTKTYMERAYNIPGNVNPSNITSKFVGGVLDIVAKQKK